MKTFKMRMSSTHQLHDNDDNPVYDSFITTV
jgi:hypothetical protein